MIVRFNSLNRTERPVLTLCNPGSTYDNGKLTNVVGILTNHEAEENVFNFNSSSELNFRLNKVTTGDDEADEYMGFLYDAVKNKRLIFIDDIGFFLINNVQEQYDNLNTFKDVTAKSIDIELQQRNIPFIPDGTYRFLDGDGKSGILNMIVDTLPYWTIGTVDSSVASKYRTFEDVDTSLNCLGFMIDNLQDAYECIILFDTINRTINVYDQNNYIHQTDIHISKKDIINMSKVSESSDDLYTAITVSGDSDVLISAVNPLGTNTLYNFSYYLDWMSAPLKEKVIAWNAKISSHEADYYNLNLDYYNKEKQAHDIELEINRLETQLSMYERCRDNIVANNDTDYVVSYNEAISASGGTVITIKPEISQTLAEIDRLIGICRTNMSNAQTQLSAINAQIEAIADEINTIRSDVSFTNNFTNDELSELNNYVFEGTYKDEYVVITDIMDYAEQFSQMKILYDRARAQLLRISQPTQEFEIDVENFLFEREFAHASDQLETGCLINVELNDNDIAELFLSSIKVNYDDHNLSLTFGNRYNKFDPKTLFDNVLGSVSKSANTLGYVKDLLYPIKAGELNAIKNQLQSARDLSMIGALTSDNEEVVIDSSGYTGRKKLSDGTYDPKQIKITNNNIVFTKDGWETSSLAIGDIILPDGSSVYGVNAQALIGDIIIGTELHIKDSQGQDILTVINGRISTEVSEVKSAAASGTFEYYDPSNLSWTEQGNVDYFGYGLSQDETETDTGVKAAGNNNKYFLNKHNGNLYKSNGTKWVFQKTLSPRFNNYSTIAYTDNKAGTAESNAKTYAEGKAATAESNAKTYAEGQANTAESNAKTYAEVKASTAESNAIANATNQVSTAKATIASSTLKYDETGITVNYYGYGAPTEIAGATQGKIYLDQNEGYYYTKGSGSNWTKSSSALPLYADQKANTAKSEAISAASADATTKANNAISTAATDATTKANTAENNAKTAAANAMSKYDEGSLTINYYGFGVPTTVAGSSQGEIYLDQNTGYYYTKGSGSTWTKSTNALPLYADQKATEAYNNALSYVGTYYITSEDASTTINQTKKEIEMTAAKAVSKYYIPDSMTISFFGYGTPMAQGVIATEARQKYLDQETGRVYTSSDDKSWSTASYETLGLITDRLDSKINVTAENITQTVSRTYSTKNETETAANNARNAAINDTTTRLENYYTKTQADTIIDQTAEQISLEANALLEATVGYTSKNRLELTIDTQTVQGVTFTVDKTNGTITANGTSTGTIDVDVPISPDLSGDYYYSGVPVGGSGNTYYMYPYDITSLSRPKKFDGITPCLDDYGGTSQEIKFIKGHRYRLSIRIQGAGFVANNLIFRPMIRDRAFADDDTFEPFANVQSVTTNLQSQITQNANQIQLKVSAGDVCSVISQSSDTITLSSGRLIINAGNFQLDSTGRMTASAGSFGGWEIGTEWVDAWSTPYESLGYWDHYIKSTNNQYGTIKLHSVGSGEIPFGMESVFITAFDITDTEGETFFKVTMDGSISTWASLFAHEAHLSQVSLGAIGYTGEEHLELRTGNLDGSGGYPPSYIKFYDASGNEHLSLVTEGIRLSQDICFRLYNNEVAIGIQSKNVRFYAKGVYLPNGSAVTSDERQKCNIERLDTRYLDIIKNIEPVRFKYLNDSMGDYHSGFIAQDVLKTLSAAGLSQSEVGAFVDTMGDGSDYALRYGEFIPMLQKWVKELDNRITEIERKIRNE